MTESENLRMQIFFPCTFYIKGGEKYFKRSVRRENEAVENISLLFCIPFAGMLLSIAVIPLIAGEWWERNKKYMVILWSVLFLIPFAVKFSAGTMVETLFNIVINDYLTFIILLFGLFCVSGNIRLYFRRSNL